MDKAEGVSFYMKEEQVYRRAVTQLGTCGKV